MLIVCLGETLNWLALVLHRKAADLYHHRKFLCVDYIGRETKVLSCNTNCPKLLLKIEMRYFKSLTIRSAKLGSSFSAIVSSITVGYDVAIWRVALVHAERNGIPTGAEGGSFSSRRGCRTSEKKSKKQSEHHHEPFSSLEVSSELTNFSHLRRFPSGTCAFAVT